MKVRINIDTLLLEGFNPADHLAISRELEQELTRLVKEKDLQAKMYEVGSLDAGTIDVPANSDANAIGIEVARSVYKSLSRNG